MIKTERIAHIKDFPASGCVNCPSCKTSVGLDVKYCPHCGEIVDYKRNVEILRNWNIDLFNFKIKIEHGLVEYESPYVGDDYRNIYNLEQKKNIIPNEYTTFRFRYYDLGVFIIHRTFWQRNEYGVLDKDGNVIISPVCEYIDHIDKRGNFVLRYNGKTGVNNIRNESIIPIVYDSIKRVTMLNSDYFVVQKSNKYGILNYQNQIVIPIEFDAIGDFSAEAIPVKSEGKWGFYDLRTKKVDIPFKYDKAGPFVNGAAKVILGNYDMYIDRNGFPTLPQNQGETENIENGKVVIRNSLGEIQDKPLFDPAYRGSDYKTYKVGDKWGAINTRGEFIIPPEYDEIYLERSGLFPVKKGHSWGVISVDGRIVLPFEYDSVIITEGLIRVLGRKFISSDSDLYLRFYGVLNRYGDVVVPIDYWAFDGFSEGLCWYEGPKAQRFGIMDKFGNYVEYNPVVKDGKFVEV